MGDKIATRVAYGKTLRELGAEKQDIVVLDADLAGSTKTAEFGKEFPDRFFNMGIAEANMIGAAAGLAASGKIPFCSTFAVFATGRVYDQIRNSVANPALNVKIAASHAGLTVGADGSSHQTVEDIALMRVLPNMRVFVPADAVETRALIRAAAALKGPVYIRLGRSAVPVIHKADTEILPGRAVRLREGQDVAIIATGIMVAEALAAARALEEEDISAAVLDMHTIKPLDTEAVLQLARTTGALVTAEEHSIIGGLGSAVAETLGEGYPVPMERVGVEDTFGESGAPDELLEKYGLTAGDIAAAARRVLKRKK